MAEKLKQEMAPAPASDKCENCDGTGKIGDGRIVMTCPVCKGTGKKVAK
jgi:DnaJ-class molecular chaperone